MCRDMKLRLIPVIIIVAGVLSGLIIASNTATGLSIIFAAALGIAFLTLCVTGILAAVCGLKRMRSEPCHDNLSLTCYVLRCLGPTVLVTALISVIASLLVIEGVFSLAIFAGLVNSILGVIFALIFSTMLVYFTSMFVTILNKND